MKIRIALLDQDTRDKLRSKNVFDKAADAELVLETGDLAGFRLAGFQVWDHRGGERQRAGQGEIEVTLPSRSYRGKNGSHFFNHLRPMVEHATEGLEALKREIVACYRQVADGAEAEAEPAAPKAAPRRPPVKAKATKAKAGKGKTRAAVKPRMRRSVAR